MTRYVRDLGSARRWRRWQARLTLVQKADIWLFAGINNLPHPAYFDNLMRLLAQMMDRGDGWLFGLLLASYRDERQGHTQNTRLMRRIAPVLWLASATVEFPLKSLFRRKRPYTQLAQAILVGAPPQRHSFPSGHAASAFAGAWLLSKYYPRWAIPFYGLALLVAFCRSYTEQRHKGSFFTQVKNVRMCCCGVYRGVHYPSDVVAGGLAGVGLAAFYEKLLNKRYRSLQC